MAPSVFVSVSCALLGMFQLSNSLIITETVHRSCPATTTASLPSCGWISTSGSSRPYCFSTSSTSSTASSIRSPPVISVTVTPLPSTIVSTQSASTATVTTSILPPPIYTPPIIAISTSTIITTTAPPSITATATTLSTVFFPPGYDDASSSSSTTITTLATIGGGPAPGYNGPTTTTTTSATSATASSIFPTGLPAYCYTNGALLNVGANVTITDNLGALYALVCLNSELALGVGLSGTDLATVRAPNNVDECMTACDANADCTGFTFESDATGTYGIGPGTCYLYSGFGLSFTASEMLQLIAFIKLDALTGLPLRKREIEGEALLGIGETM